MLLEHVSVSGPGRVWIEGGCAVRPNMFRGLSIVTLAPEAEVRIGRNCDLGGLTIICGDRVTLGEQCMTACSLVQDTLLCHDVAPRGGSATGNYRAPVTLGRNVWLGGQAAVLPGTLLGDDSVMGWGACAFGTEYPPFSLVMGSPAGRPLPIGQVIGLRSGS
jgi:acetyltransferase-like isoleucine patch superfamily enzyme